MPQENPVFRALITAAQSPNGAMRTAENSRYIDGLMASGALCLKILDEKDSPISSKRYVFNDKGRENFANF